jgi:ATP-dependent protease ClpP protease subunit
MKKIEININGAIGKENNTFENVKKTLDQFDLSNAKIVVNIDSLGGFVDDAFGIYEYLNHLKNEYGVIVETLCNGDYVASSATIIAQAASPNMRGISKKTSYLIHCCTRDGENSFNNKSHRDNLIRHDKRIAEVYSDNSNGILNEKRALKIMRENKGDGEWQKPREVIENGLADFIIEDDFIIEKRQSFILRIFNKLKNIF